MGVEIGFRLYDKRAFAESKALIEVKADQTKDEFVCGRSPATGAWERWFSDTAESSTVPVFQKELDGLSRTTDAGIVITYKTVGFDEFQSSIREVIANIRNGSAKNVKAASDRLADIDKEIDELRGWQLKCDEGSSFAFERWGERIADLKEKRKELIGYIRDPEEQDYDLCRAKNVEELLDSMCGHINANDDLVIPYDSY